MYLYFNGLRERIARDVIALCVLIPLIIRLKIVICRRDVTRRDTLDPTNCNTALIFWLLLSESALGLCPCVTTEKEISARSGAAVVFPSALTVMVRAGYALFPIFWTIGMTKNTTAMTATAINKVNKPQNHFFMLSIVVPNF